MQATRFEFERRFWVMAVIFFVGFSFSWIDHTGFASAVVRLVAPLVDPESEQWVGLLHVFFFIAAAVVVLAAMLRTWATAYLRTEIVHDPGQHADRLVADGPYRHVRNPLYLAVILLAAAIATMATRLGWAFIVIAVTVFLFRLIRREEAGLLATQGDSYRAYLRAVPRLIPSPWPRVPAGSTRPRWRQAFVGESYFWLFAAAMIVLACTLNATLAVLISLGSLVLYAAASAVVMKRVGKK